MAINSGGFSQQGFGDIIIKYIFIVYQKREIRGDEKAQRVATAGGTMEKGVPYPISIVQKAIDCARRMMMIHIEK